MADPPVPWKVALRRAAARRSFRCSSPHLPAPNASALAQWEGATKEELEEALDAYQEDLQWLSIGDLREKAKANVFAIRDLLKSRNVP